jgi:hypothetical protein
MKDVPNILTPMKKQLIKHFVCDEFIEILLELFGEYIVEFVYNCQYFLKKVGMLRVENGCDSSIKIIVMKIIWEHLMVIKDRTKVALD